MIQEFVKELINRLEEYAERYDDIAFAEMNENGQTLDFEYARGKKEAMKEIAFTINRLAEKYSDAAAVPITPEMKADLLDCIKETKVPGGGKDCNTCSLNKTNYHGKAFCEVEQIKEKILQGAEAVKPDEEKCSTGMERITKYINDGKAVCFAKCEKECVYGYMMDDVTCDCEVVQSAKKRLAEYEALGVTAEQIREMDRLYAEKCKEVAELEKRLEAMIEPWE